MPVVSQADDIVVADGMWKITYMESEKAFRINVLNEGGDCAEVCREPFGFGSPL